MLRGIQWKSNFNSYGEDVFQPKKISIKLLKLDLIEFPSNGTPCKKSFLDEDKGKVVADMWFHIQPCQSSCQRKTRLPNTKTRKA